MLDGQAPPIRRPARRDVDIARPAGASQYDGRLRGAAAKQRVGVEDEQLTESRPGAGDRQAASVGRQVRIDNPCAARQSAHAATLRVERVEVALQARAAREFELVENRDAMADSEASPAVSRGLP